MTFSVGAVFKLVDWQFCEASSGAKTAFPPALLMLERDIFLRVLVDMQSRADD